MIRIYTLTHIESGRLYVGVTKSKLSKRWGQHLRDARLRRTSVLHRAILKYGADAFRREVIERHDDDDVACARERELIALLNTRVPHGFNVAAGGRVRFEVSAETRERIALKLRGREVSADTRAKLSAAKKGRKLPPISDEAREKRRISATGKTHTTETRAKISAASAGRKHTEQARANMSAAGRGKPKSAAHNAAVSAAKMGWVPSPETRTAMSEGQRLRWERWRRERAS